MKGVVANLKWPIIVSSILVLPLLILELKLNPLANKSDAVALFGFLWLLPFAFVLVLTPLV